MGKSYTTHPRLNQLLANEKSMDKVPVGIARDGGQGASRTEQI